MHCSLCFHKTLIIDFFNLEKTDYYSVMMDDNQDKETVGSMSRADLIAILKSSGILWYVPQKGKNSTYSILLVGSATILG